MPLESNTTTFLFHRELLSGYCINSLPLICIALVGLLVDFCHGAEEPLERTGRRHAHLRHSHYRKFSVVLFGHVQVASCLEILSEVGWERSIFPALLLFRDSFRSWLGKELISLGTMRMCQHQSLRRISGFLALLALTTLLFSYWILPTYPRNDGRQTTTLHGAPRSVEEVEMAARDYLIAVRGTPPPLIDKYNVKRASGEWRACNVTSIGRSECDSDYLFGDVPFLALVEEIGPCQRYGDAMGDFTTGSFSQKTSGEAKLCARLTTNLNRLGYDVMYLTKSLPYAEWYFEQLYQQGKPRIAAFHRDTGKHKIRVIQTDTHAIPARPFNHLCFLRVAYFGVEKYTKDQLWVGAESRYISAFPMGNNTHMGVDADICHRDDLQAGQNSTGMVQLPISLNKTSRELMENDSGEPYAFLIGKWGFKGTAKSDQVNQMFVNNTKLWDHVTTRTNLVMLNCPDEFFELTGATKSKFVCLNTESKFRKELYVQLVQNAQFMLGIGSPRISPSPIEALSCSRPVVLSRGMHRYLQKHIQEPDNSVVEKEEELLQAFEKILSSEVTAKVVRDSTRDVLTDLLYRREDALKELMVEVESSCANQITKGFYSTLEDISEPI